MKRIALLVYLCLIISIFSNDIEKDGLKGAIKSIISTQYEMIPNPKNPTEYITNNENKKIVFIGEYDKEGTIIKKYFNYEDIKSVYVNGYSQSYYDYTYYIGNHLDNLVNHYDISFNGFEFLNDKNGNYKVGIYTPNYNKINELKIENTYEKEKIKEKIVYDKNGDFLKKINFSYKFDKKSLTNLITVETYNKSGNLWLTEKFNYDSKNKLISYERDNFQKINFLYDKNEKLSKFTVFEIDEKILEIKQEYNDQNLLVSKDIITKVKRGSLKYEYDLDSKGNIIKIRVYQTVEKIGQKLFEPIFIQVNNIEYY